MRRRSVTATVVAGLMMSILLPAPGRAAATGPELTLLAGSDDVTIRRAEGRSFFLDLGIYLAAAEAPFELRVSRPDYSSPIEVHQTLHASDGSTQSRRLPADILDGWEGLAQFLSIRVTDPAGRVVLEDRPTFCPNGYTRQRTDDAGAVNPRYPSSCVGNPFSMNNPFTLGTILGIEEGWGTNVSESLLYRFPSGSYTATVSIAERYLSLFDIDPGRATQTVALTVKTVERIGKCRHMCGGYSPRSAHDAAPASVPVDESPDAATLPDLIPLPAWNLRLRETKSKTWLSFSANVWDGGNAPLVVEGFRREGQDVMDAYQYFYGDGEPRGKAEVGSFEFDLRDGHRHWHFRQFARYALLNEDLSEVLRSKKEAFCLVPTDPIDLVLPGAAWDPDRGDLSSSCGNPNSLWIRETLPLGWGDTYVQSLPGQSFDISGLPNGTYYLLVEANPDGLLHEVTTENNVELREVRIKGRAGDRRLVVPPWNGIETERPRAH